MKDPSRFQVDRKAIPPVGYVSINLLEWLVLVIESKVIKKNKNTKSNANLKKGFDQLKHDNQHSHHPDHSVHLKRLHRVKGQLDGIEKMIQGKRYCPDIVTQIKAASAALKAIEAEIFKSHLRGCVKSAFKSHDSFESEDKIQEIMKMVF